MLLLKKFYKDSIKNKALVLMLLPAVAYFFIFSYLPMMGIIVAFKSYDYSKGIFGSPWVGFSNFKYFFISGQAFKVTRNTVLYNLTFIIVNTVLELSVAVFLSQIGSKYFKKITQTTMLLPYFVSWVVVGAFLLNIFNYEFGAFNSLLKSLGSEPVAITITVWVWKYIIVFFAAWKDVGYVSIIYFAAIMGIDKEIYESAEIDGAGITQKIFYITLPNLKPTISIMILLSVGQIFRGNFSMFYQIVGNNGLLFDSTDVIDTFVFRSLLFTQEIGMSASIGLYQSVLCLVVLLVTNRVIKFVDEDYALF